MSRALRWFALVAAALAVLPAGCGHPTPESAKREAVETLDETGAAVAADLRLVRANAAAMVHQCAVMPGWPTSKRAWEVSHQYELAPGQSPADRVDRTRALWEGRGGKVVYHRDHGRGPGARVTLPGGPEVFARSAGGQLELKVRSRCLEPGPR